MSKAVLVKINTDYVAQFMKANGISGAEFSKRLGYSEYWWKGVANKNQAVKKNVAVLMCNVYGLEPSKLIARSEPATEYGTLAVDSEVVEAFGKWLAQIENKLDKLLAVWGE